MRRTATAILRPVHIPRRGYLKIRAVAKRGYTTLKSGQNRGTGHDPAWSSAPATQKPLMNVSHANASRLPPMQTMCNNIRDKRWRFDGGIASRGTRAVQRTPLWPKMGMVHPALGTKIILCPEMACGRSRYGRKVPPVATVSLPHSPPIPVYLLLRDKTDRR